MEQIPLEQKKINNLIKQCRHFNIFPYQLDWHFPKTDNHPVSDLLDELVKECSLFLEIMPSEEIEALIESFPFFYKERITYKTSWLNKSELHEKTSLYYIMFVVQKDYFSIKDLLTLELSNSEVLRIYPELSEKFDDEGLLFIDEDFRLIDGGIFYKDHVLHYHQFLRRGYHSNPNFDFLGAFIRYRHLTKKQNTFRIAIDHRRIMPKEFYQFIGEKDVWFGTTFDENKLDDLNSTGLTVVGRSKPSKFDLFFDRLERTEFFRSYRNGIKTFEIEEISEEAEEDYYLNKYIHSERDVKAKILRHFDGAVKIYLKNQYKSRLASNIPNELKSFKKIKLFRIDGEIDIDIWIELIALFCKGNEMIIEYFNPEEFEQRFGEEIRHYQKVMQERDG